MRSSTSSTSTAAASGGRILGRQPGGPSGARDGGPVGSAVPSADTAKWPQLAREHERKHSQHKRRKRPLRGWKRSLFINSAAFTRMSAGTPSSGVPLGW